MGIDYRVLQEAAKWFAVLQSGAASAGERQAWSAWLEQPEHARAWAKVERISGQFQPLADDAVGRTAGAMLHSRQSSRRQALKVLSVLCGGAALSLAGGSLPWRQWTADERTAVGEVRDLRLADGSQLWLNTDTAVDIADDATARRLALYHGELLVDASPSQGGRPLLLTSREGRVRSEQAARFSLRQEDGHTRLSVFAGVVDIQAGWLRHHPCGGRAADRFQSPLHRPPVGGPRRTSGLGERRITGRQPAPGGFPRRTVALSTRLSRLRSAYRRSARGRRLSPR